MKVLNPIHTLQKPVRQKAFPHMHLAHFPFIQGLSKPGPTKNKRTQNSRGHYPNYFQDQLIQAGDVEQHPGPTVRRRTNRNNHNSVHLMTILITLILLINSIQKWLKVSDYKSLNLKNPRRSNTQESGTLIFTEGDYLTHSFPGIPKVYPANLYRHIISETITLDDNAIHNFCEPGIIQVQEINLLTAGLNAIANLRRLGTRKFSNNIPKITKSSMLTILLIIAGDVHTNPGPHHNSTCATCESGQFDSTSSVSCETCSNWHHKEIPARLGDWFCF